MGQSLVNNYVHIVFSTKHREPLIKPPFEEELHAYLGGTCKKLGCPVLIVGGYTDHVHILCMLSKNIALSELLKQIKQESSKWMKTKHDSLKSFTWQGGYGAFSVNPKGIEVVKEYIKNQHRHHSKKSFKQEYVSILEKEKVDYNEKYVWD